MATLPAQIQRDLDRANAMLTPPQQSNPQEGAPPARAEVMQVQQPASEPAAAQSELRPPSEDWQQKYRTLQGIHARETQNFRARVEQLEGAIRELQSRPAATHTPEPVAMNPQDAEVFGEDLVEMVRRTAESAQGATVSQLEQRLRQLEQQTAGTTAVVSKTADDMFYERLESLVPDWATVNKDEGFLTWLAEEDPLYGLPRQAALTRAGEQRDVQRVANVFNTWKRAAGQPDNPASRPSEPTVSPRSSGNGAVREMPAAGGALLTVAQVEAFYKDVRHGLYRGREQEMAAQEAVINAALAENRIVQSLPRRSM